MKKIFLAIALVAVLAMVFAGCSGKSNSGSSSGNSDNSAQSASQSGGKQLITADTKTGEGSEARDQYFADTVREEFTFEKNGILTDYKRIYTFVDSADKEKALDRITAADFKANINGNTLVVDGDGNYLGFPYADSNFDEIKERADSRGTQYTVK